MRQFVSWRFWASFGMVALLALVLWTCRGDGGADSASDSLDTARRIDLVVLTSVVRSDAPWSITDGRVVGNATVVLENGRTLLLAQGTVGDVSCLYPDVVDACVLVADTLGDGVVWFSLVPAPPSGSRELELPAMTQLLDGVTYARLANGWEIPLLDKVERRCDIETPNLTSFVQRFAGRHVTIVDLDQQ
ncbi:MAG: hypothetical protein RL391_1774, partial [Actinomycetota bacterium]